MEDEEKYQREYKIQKAKDAVYRFFYNIWPSVSRTLNFFYYYTIKILKAFGRIAMEQFRSK